MEKITFYGRDNEYIEETAYNIDDFKFKDNYPIVKERKRKSRLFYNIPIVFDIETTSIINKNEENLKDSFAFMYQWQMCIDDTVVFGRTWREYLKFINRIIDELSTEQCHVVIYAHNLSFESQFMIQFLRKIDNDIDIFYTKKRMPLVIRLKTVGIEFRCSWKLSNMSAEKYIENSGSKYLKQTAIQYDYKKVRTPKTPLTMEEKGYCYCDVRGVADAIRKEFEHGYNITTIPLTSTSFVRRDTRRMYKYYDTYVNNEKVPEKYREIFDRLPHHVIKEKDKPYHFRDGFKACRLSRGAYEQAVRTSRGGDTHANCMKSGIVHKNVYSFDRVSSYPAVIMTKKYPMSKFLLYEPENTKELIRYLDDKKMSTMVTLYLSNVKVKKGVRSPYIPYAKCTSGKNVRLDNGRVYKADGICIHITEIDWDIIKDSYDFTIDFYENCYRAKNDFLPLPLRAVTMMYFYAKCQLKGMDKYLYMKSKNKLNGIFGMCFTNPVHDKTIFDLQSLEWFEEETDIDYALDKYYNNKESCLRYEHGLYITAWARWELYQAVKATGDAYIYSDTDSVKWATDDREEEERILKWFDNRNKELENEAIVNGAYCDYNNKRYVLGIWENEAESGSYMYESFKTYGAKKYAYHYADGADKDHATGDFGITVAGLSKGSGARYIADISRFNVGLEIDSENSGRTTAIWRDEHIHYVSVMGERILTASSCAVADTTYTLGVTNDYKLLLHSGQFIFT